MIAGLSIVLLILGTGSAFASVELDAYLPINGHPVTPIFKFSKTVTIDYSSTSKLKTDLTGRNITIAFTDDSDDNPTIKSFMEQINQNIATHGSITSTITHLTIQYASVISGDNKQATIDYLVTLRPTLTNYVLKSGSDGAPTILDLSWMGFNVKDPLVVATKQYGNLEINFPLEVLQNQLPYSYDILKDIPQDDFAKLNLIDSSPLDSHSIDQWNTLFDPTYTLDDTAGYEYAGQKVAATAFSYGQSDIYQGSEKLKTVDIDFTADSKYHLTIVERASSGTIDVEGHANGYLVQGYPTISTLIMRTGYISSPMSDEHPIGGLSTVEIYTIAGIAAAIAVSLFLWNYRKRLK
jgi:hypothetical protein